MSQSHVANIVPMGGVLSDVRHKAQELVPVQRGCKWVLKLCSDAVHFIRQTILANRMFTTGKQLVLLRVGLFWGQFCRGLSAVNRTCLPLLLRSIAVYCT